MSDPRNQRLYTLLPTIYRVRDAAPGMGEPLRSMLAVIESEFDLLEGDIQRLYDNWFIETCDEWIVPYIGDLLGVRGLLSVRDGTFSQRAFVANTLAYRRGKGTAAILEQIGRDITGWPAKAVEFFLHLATTQHVNHVRLARPATVDLRTANQLELLHTPFEQALHTGEMRHIDNQRGKYNIPNVGIFLWRLQSYVVSRAAARPADGLPTGLYRFSPLGLDIQLFNRPRTETGITHAAGEENVPGLLRRRPLYDELEERRAAQIAGQSARPLYFGPPPVIEVALQETMDAPIQLVAAENLLICHLDDPAPPAPPLTDWRRPDAPGVGEPVQVAVDPVSGRLALPAGQNPHKVYVSYAYGFPGDVGGGPYNRQASVEEWRGSATVNWHIGVTQNPEIWRDPLAPNQLVATLEEAIQAWNAAASAELLFGLITILDSDTYAAPTATVSIPPGCTLAIVAANWPVVDAPDRVPPLERINGLIIADNLRPHILGDIAVQGTAGAQDNDQGTLIMDGLLVEGQLTVQAGRLGSLWLAHTTLVPGSNGLMVEGDNETLTVRLTRSIGGPVRLGDKTPRLTLEDSILDGGSGPAIVAPNADAQITACTILGRIDLRTLQASNSVFRDVVDVVRRQAGCVRFSFLPLASLAPRRYRCQPTPTNAGRVTPHISSVVYGDPDYGQLDPTCPAEIAAGAEDEGEMGVFYFLQQPQRLQVLRTSLAEYMRFGLEVGVFLVN